MFVGYYSFYNYTLISISFDRALYCIFISCAFASCILVLRHTPICGYHSQCLWSRFVQYERFVSHKLQIIINYDRFRHNYNRKIYVSLAGFLFVFVARIVYRLSQFDDSLGGIRYAAALILIFLTVLIDFQILFYISLLGYMMKLVNRHIVDLFCAVDCGERNRRIVQTLRDYKVVHYKLWEITQLINEHFGWVFVALIMQKVNGTVQSFYWIIVDLHEEHLGSYAAILSKSRAIK